MITAVEVQTNLREYDTKNRRLVLGVSGASLNSFKCTPTRVRRR